MTISLEKSLKSLNSRYYEITNLIENIFYFSDMGEEPNDDEINDGGEDLFDGGNFISTSLEGEPLNYTHTQDAGVTGGEGLVETIPYLNPEMDGIIIESPENSGSSKYFTNMYPGLFAFGAENPTAIRTNGDMGSDGEESINSLDENQTEEDGKIYGKGYTTTYKNQNFTVYTKTSYDQEERDPTLHHIMIVPGNNSNWSHLIGENNNDEYDEYIDFQDSKPSVAFFFLFTTFNSEEEKSASPVSNLAEIVNKIIEIIYNTGTIQRKLTPEYEFEVIAYRSEDLLDNRLNENYSIIEKRLKTQEIEIEGMDGKFKHGDKFSASGYKALYLKKTYVDVDVSTGRKLLKII